MFRLFYVILLGMVIAGCASTQSPSKVSALQIKVAHLEQRLEERDIEISSLKSDVSSLMTAVDALKSKSPVQPKRVSIEATKIPVTSGKVSSGTGIIRVAISTQKVQAALQGAGYYNGSIDGKIGSGTRQAIREFQTEHDLKSDGIVGPQTWGQLKNYLE